MEKKRERERDREISVNVCINILYRSSATINIITYIQQETKDKQKLLNITQLYVKQNHLHLHVIYYVENIIVQKCENPLNK